MKAVKLLLMIILPVLVLRAGVAEEVDRALGMGNAKMLSRHFDNTIQLNILTNSSNYSRNHAEIVIDNFFSEHPVRAFEVSSRGSSYCVGTLHTATGSFKTNYMLKNVDGTAYIQQLNIQK